MSSRRKGVSPIIAVVILIAVAVSIGIMVTTWVTHWVTTQTGSDEIICAVDTNYVIDSAKFDSTTNINHILMKITNKGEEGLYGVGVVLDNGTNVVHINSTGLTHNPNPEFGNTSLNLTVSPNISASNKLTQEQSAYVTVKMNNTNGSVTNYWTIGFAQTLTEIRLTNDACPSVSIKTNSITQV